MAVGNKSRSAPAIALVVGACAFGGCGDNSKSAGGGTPDQPAAPKTGDHGAAAVTALGEQEINGMQVRASRDGQGALGADAPIDVWVNGGTAGLAAVRFWIGSEDAKGSIKAKAEIEDDKWHTHAEVPTPLPAGSKLWVELETQKGEKSVLSFDLKN
ncbi:MAG: hypothetical protein FJ293_04615 [Planctomycetes bacterium]|nr:hypothetical protein [Planctomycetota bacterium]